ncbi:ABC transporter substrate-binding protein [Cucumibacter marinus]|uniref:ABC transporter substrate-binding protein n=1 Tax=Cucumibacter marinus TaxID=1121252 RepID=UPI0004208217|nr:ABC transporter substrate-binding protein [Cucumibacter marinus]
MKTRAIIHGLAAAALLAGSVSTAMAADEIDVRFSWKLKGEYGLFYYGQSEGFYEDNDITLNLGEGAGSQAALGALVQGQEDVVVMPAIFAISAIQRGMPVKIAALYQPAAAIALISHPDNPVLEPKDLEGKSIAHSVGETGTSYLGVFCAANNIDCDSINKVQMDSGSRVPQFIQRQVDAVSVYMTNDLPVLEARLDTEFPTLVLADHGLAVPGMAAVVSNDGIAENSDALKRFLAATAKSIEATRADPIAATEALKSVWQAGPDNEVVLAQIEATSDSIPEASEHPVGWIDERLIAKSLEMLQTQDDLGELRPLGEFYTNELLSE